MRAVQDVGPAAADERGQTGLLPREADRGPGDGRRTGEQVHARQERAVVLDVVRLDDDGEVGALLHQRREELVDVAADAPAVGRHGGGVDDHARTVRQEDSRDGGVRGGGGWP